MRIKDISVENYRNLNSATITFDESCNFIVGENNLGKSNILNLLNIIFTRRGFVYDDFNDAKVRIIQLLRITSSTYSPLRGDTQENIRIDSSVNSDAPLRK